MHLGETLLIIGSLVIFGAVSLFINGARLDSERIMMETEFQITAIGLAQSFIEEAKGLPFDEGVVDSLFTGRVPESFTAENDLGPESGEDYPLFDDVDDYNGLFRHIDTPRASYTVEVTVGYADSVTLAPQGVYRSLFKIMNVRVASAFFRDTVQCSYLFTFY